MQKIFVNDDVSSGQGLLDALESVKTKTNAQLLPWSTPFVDLGCCWAERSRLLVHYNKSRAQRCPM